MPRGLVGHASAGTNAEIAFALVQRLRWGDTQALNLPNAEDDFSCG
jgi:hypothetical protein